MIRIMKFSPNKLSADNSQVLVFGTVLALVLLVAGGAFAPSAQAQSGSRSGSQSSGSRLSGSQSFGSGQSGSRSNGRRSSRSDPFGERPLEEEIESSSDITRAREKARNAKKKFDTVKKLSRLGSASQKNLRDAELRKRLAILELSNLVSPELKSQNSLMRAKLVVNYRSKELEVIKSLHQRGSASQLELQRAKTAQEVAASRLKAIQSGSDAQRKVQVISAANSKYESAKKEHQLAAKLLQSGSISQAVMDRAKSNLAVAKSELAEAKKSLGAKAYQVQQ